jgi:hypothetical protein
MPSSFRPCLSILAAALLLSPSCSAFYSPLSDQAVREAYFLGQRRDESFASFMDKYTKRLAPPKMGPHVASITFFTPFALAAQVSSQHSSGYSAQQAALDHRGQAESVKIIVQILLTNSYPAYIPRPTGSRSGSPVGYVLRPFDFWKDFNVQVFNEDLELRPFTSLGEPNYLCSEDGGCTLTGATIQFEFLAESFASDSTTIQVTPPEGNLVSLDCNLSALR